MRLYLLRHGIAEEPETWSGDDAFRPLTAEGEKKTRAAARGLAQLVANFDVIASSPLVRARQTADIARQFYDNAPLAVWPELENAEYSALVERLRTLRVETILLVGHEPGLSRFAARLLTNRENGCRIEMKKAGVCALEVEWSVSLLTATLLWHATPTLLRLVGKS